MLSRPQTCVSWKHKHNSSRTPNGQHKQHGSDKPVWLPDSFSDPFCKPDPNHSLFWEFRWQWWQPCYSLCDLLSKNTATSKQSERIHTIPTRRLSVIFPKLCWTLDTISMPTIYHLLVTIVSELETGGQTHGKQTTRARYTETVEVGEPEPKLDPNSLLK